VSGLKSFFSCGASHLCCSLQLFLTVEEESEVKERDHEPDFSDFWSVACKEPSNQRKYIHIVYQ
jgi:hypothetical protein